MPMRSKAPTIWCDVMRRLVERWDGNIFVWQRPNHGCYLHDMVRRWMGVVCSMEGYTVHHWDEGEDYFQGGRDLTEWAYWVLILQIRCIFSAKLSKRFDRRSQILSKRSFPGERILWENYPKILTFSSVYNSPRKVYNAHANATLVKKNTTLHTQQPTSSVFGTLFLTASSEPPFLTGSCEP